MRVVLQINYMDSQNSANAVDYFVDSLWLEDGLSKNTLDSYRRDLHLFSLWLRETENVESLLKVSNNHVLGYLAHCFD
jgi:integrase/recombinase XerD